MNRALKPAANCFLSSQSSNELQNKKIKKKKIRIHVRSIAPLGATYSLLFQGQTLNQFLHTCSESPLSAQEDPPQRMGVSPSVFQHRLKKEVTQLLEHGFFPLT